jgi:hypothetical protein
LRWPFCPAATCLAFPMRLRLHSTIAAGGLKRVYCIPAQEIEWGQVTP